MQFSSSPPRYRAFLLRCWEEREDLSHASHWRFSLEEAGTTTRRSFANFAALVAFLEDQISLGEPTNKPNSQPTNKPIN